MFKTLLSIVFILSCTILSKELKRYFDNRSEMLKIQADLQKKKDVITPIIQTYKEKCCITQDDRVWCIFDPLECKELRQRVCDYQQYILNDPCYGVAVEKTIVDIKGLWREFVLLSQIQEKEQMSKKNNLFFRMFK